MKAHRHAYPLMLMCRVFEVSKSGYHAWLKRPPSKRSQENARLEVAIRSDHQSSRETYGPIRLRPELAAAGFLIGIGRIKRIPRKLGLRCKPVKKFKATTNSNHSLSVTENLLNQDFATTRPGQAWVTDITYHPNPRGLALPGGCQGSAYL